MSLVTEVGSHVRPGSSNEPATSVPLRVLFYCCFPAGGIGRYTHELLNRLNSLSDLEVELACLPSYHWRDTAAYSVWPELREISHPSAWRRRTRFLISQFANPRRLFQRAAATGARIVHLSNINHLTFSYWKHLAADSSLRIVATAHDIERARSMLNRAYEDRQLRSFYRRADALFVHSQAQADHLQQFAAVPADRIHLVPHGPYDYGRPTAAQSALRSKFGLPRDKQIALFFGNIRDEKNLELMIRSLSGFQDKVHLLVAGRGDGGQHKPVAYYRSLTDQLSLHDAVTFIDRYVADNEIPDLFEVSDWVALPYSTSFTSQSGVLNVAMSYRRPVLATDAPTLGETLRNADVGVLVKPDSLEALTEGISRIRQHLATAHTFAFDEYLSQYSWDQNAGQTVAVYRSLLQQQCNAKGRHLCAT